MWVLECTSGSPLTGSETWAGHPPSHQKPPPTGTGWVPAIPPWNLPWTSDPSGGRHRRCPPRSLWAECRWALRGATAPLLGKGAVLGRAVAAADPLAHCWQGVRGSGALAKAEGEGRAGSEADRAWPSRAAPRLPSLLCLPPVCARASVSHTHTRDVDMMALQIARKSGRRTNKSRGG